MSPGENDIIAEALDLTGKTFKTTHKIICDRTGPALNIDEFVPADSPGNRYVARVYVYDDDSGIKQVTINGKTISELLLKEVVLNHYIILPDSSGRAVIEAEDRAGNKTRADIYPSIKSAGSSSYIAFLDSRFPRNGGMACDALLSLASYYAENGIKDRHRDKRGYGQNEANPGELGNYHALIIGIDEYTGWKHLKTPVNDVQTLKKILGERYFGFSPENITLRINKDATQATLRNDLKRITSELKENNNLLVYFAGHGELDKNEGYWVPVGGKKNEPDTWLSNSSIREMKNTDIPFFKMAFSVQKNIPISKTVYLQISFP
ncbi:MAG: caspase family protein [Desulfobacteraceae bacterium]|nr:caspase family protein [Desulfobacteraceae bacterium]